MANQIVGFEPDPNTPGAGTASLSDGSTLYGRQSDFAPYLRDDQSTGTAIPQGQGQPQGQPAFEQPAGNPMLEAGLRSLGATPQDIAAQYALQQTGRNVDLPTLLAAKKTQVIPGSPAITPNTEANQFAWRTGKQTVTEGQRPIDEERWNNVQRLAGEAVDAQSRAQIAEAQASQQTAMAQANAAAQLHEQMQLEQSRQEQAWQAQHAQLVQEVSDAAKSAPDQNRWFAEHGATGTIFAILGSMFQGYGAGLHGQFGPTMLERFIDKDIALQQRQLELRGAAAQNKLADLSRQYGSIDAGRAALRASQLRMADMQLQALAASERSPAVLAQIEAQKKQLESKIAEADFQMRAAAQGTQRTAESAQYMLPRRATAGGVRTTYNLGTALEGERADTKLANTKSEGQQSAEGRAERLGERLAQFEQTSQAADTYFRSVGLERDKSGKWVQRGDHPLYGAVDTLRNGLPAAAMSNEANKAEAALAIAAESYGRAQSGAAISDVERKAFQRQIAGTGQADAADAANAFEAALDSRMRALKAGAGPEASTLYARGREREAQASHVTAKRQGGFQSTGLKVDR